MWPEDYSNPNTRSEHPEEELAAFALNALDDAEFQAVFHHVIRCLHCQEVLLGFQDAAARLTEAAPETPLPPGLKSRVLGAVAGRTEVADKVPATLPPADARWSLRRLRRWVAPTAIGVLSLLLAASVGFMVSQQREIDQLTATTQRLAERQEVVPAVNTPAIAAAPAGPTAVAPEAPEVARASQIDGRVATSAAAPLRPADSSITLTPGRSQASGSEPTSTTVTDGTEAVHYVQQEMSDMVAATVLSAQPETEELPMKSPMGTEPEAQGVFMINPSGRQAVLMVTGMPADSYQIWLVRDNKQMLVDRIVVNEDDGSGVKQLELDESVFGFNEVALMPDERHGPTAPTGEKFLSARIINGPPMPAQIYRGR